MTIHPGYAERNPDADVRVLAADNDEYYPTDYIRDGFPSQYQAYMHRYAGRHDSILTDPEYAMFRAGVIDSNTA